MKVTTFYSGTKLFVFIVNGSDNPLIMLLPIIFKLKKINRIAQ